MNISLLGIGYLGSELLKYFSIEHNIITLDHGKYYEKILKSREINFNNIQLCKGDILDTKLLDKSVSQADVIINLTGGGGNAACIQNPVKYINTYIIGMQKVVQKAEEYGIKHIFLSSSISVYPLSNNDNIPIVTEKTPTQPANVYGVLKLASERILEESSLNYTILRFSNIYGYTDINPIQEGGALGNFIKSAFEEKDIGVYGEGTQKIDYVHIKDVCNCVTILLTKLLSGRKIYNIGSGTVKTINEIANIILESGNRYIGKKIKILKIPIKNTPFSYPLMSIDKIKTEVGWYPKIELEKGIEEMIVQKLRGGIS